MENKTGLLFLISIIFLLTGACQNRPLAEISVGDKPTSPSVVAWNHKEDIIITGMNWVEGYTSWKTLGFWNVSKGELIPLKIDDLLSTPSWNQLDINAENDLILLSATWMPGYSYGEVVLIDFVKEEVLGYWEGDIDEGGYQETIQEAEFSPDGSKFAIAGSFYIRVFDTFSQDQMLKIDTGAGEVKRLGDEKLGVDMVWSPDGTKIAWKILYKLYVYDLLTDEITILKNDEIGDIPHPNSCLDWSSDGTLLSYVTGSELVFINPYEGTLEFSIEIVQNMNIYCSKVIFSPNNERIGMCSSKYDYLAVWDINTKEILFEKSKGKGCDDFDWSPDSTKIVVAEWNSNILKIFKIEE